jgi:hypothetical protein
MPFGYDDKTNVTEGQKNKGTTTSGNEYTRVGRQRDARTMMSWNHEDIQVTGGPGDIEFLLAWNAKADLTKILAFSTVGITARGLELICELIKEGKDNLKNYPNLTPEQWRWIRETGHPFAIGNYWEENSKGKPLVFVNLWGHGTLGLINMAVADALFPNSPLLALVTASIMYTNFELFGEGSARIKYEPNDFFISNIIPILGSQAVADLFGLEQPIPKSVVASAQALVYALFSGKKMTKEDWLKLAPYPVFVWLLEHAHIFEGRSALLAFTFEHIRTTFGFSKGIGPYTGLGYSTTLGNTNVTLGIGMGPKGQRASVSALSEGFYATVYGERAYLPQGGTDYRFGAEISVPLGRTDSELEKVRESVKRDVKWVFQALKNQAPDKEGKSKAGQVQQEIEHAIDKAADTEALISFKGKFFGSWQGFQSSISPTGKIDKKDFDGILEALRHLSLDLDK